MLHCPFAAPEAPTRSGQSRSSAGENSTVPRPLMTRETPRFRDRRTSWRGPAAKTYSSPSIRTSSKAPSLRIHLSPRA
ncbi:MAG: hypothetical protein A2W08_19500 [Candidatus Rokubacteria bacterium RBG_16_73_20]|nr:MAG: hypothetical protein A2W08_19500 [Candidatus Rokubacteria bacterium RBG_16_73_20]